MKLAVVVNSAWNLYNFRLNLLKTLKAKGYEIHLIAPYDEYVSKLQAEGFRYYPLKMSAKGVNPISDFLLLLRLRTFYKQIKPNACLHYTIKPNVYGSIVCQWLHIPVINNVTGLGTAFIRPGLVNKIVRFLYRYAFRKASMVFFQNEDDLQLFKKYELVKPEQSGILPGSGVDIQKFHPISGSLKERITFLMIARILVDKGIREFLTAAKKIKSEYPNAHFVLIGSYDENSGYGVPKSEVQTYLDEKIVEYKPFTNAIVTELHSCDVVVLPSYREGTPKTLLEAAACGKPLLASDAPGCKDVVVEGINGYQCKVRDAEDLYRIMKLFINTSAEKRIEMGIESRKLVERNYDEKFVIQQYELVLDQVLSFEAQKNKLIQKQNN